MYMALLSTFCTNSINILAGINGSEVSQAVVIASSIILNDLLFLPWPVGFRIPLPLHVTDGVKVGGVWSAGMAYGSRILVERHLFSLYLMLPLLGVCLGFMYHNWCVLLYAQWAISRTRASWQVSRPCVSRRHALLRNRHGLRSRRNSSALLQDAAPVLPPPNL